MTDTHRPTEDQSLLPCPFCGKAPSINVIEPHTHSEPLKRLGMPDHPGSVVIECGCGAGLIDDTLEQVRARWNARSSGEPSENLTARPDGATATVRTAANIAELVGKYPGLGIDTFVPERDYNQAENHRRYLQQEVERLGMRLRIAPEPREKLSLPEDPVELLVTCARDAGFSEPQWRSMFYESGPYDISLPSYPTKRFIALVLERLQSSTTKTGKPLDMSGQPMGDPHPLDLAKNGQCVVCGGQGRVGSGYLREDCPVCSSVNGEAK